MRPSASGIWTVLIAAAMALVSCGPTSSKDAGSRLAGGAASHLWFVRHAESQRNAGWNGNDDGFSGEGWNQVGRLKDQLGHMGVYFDKVVISPLWRTKETINPFLNAYSGSYNHGDVRYDGGLIECCWDGSSSNPWPAQQAADRLMGEIHSAGRPLNILVVGHYFSGRYFIQRLNGQWPNPQPAQPLYFEVW